MHILGLTEKDKLTFPIFRILYCNNKKSLECLSLPTLISSHIVSYEFLLTYRRNKFPFYQIISHRFKLVILERKGNHCPHWLWVCSLALSHVWLFVTPWTVTLKAPPSVEFSRQEYWSRLPFPIPGDLPNPEIKSSFLMSLILVGGFFITTPPREPAHTGCWPFKKGIEAITSVHIAMNILKGNSRNVSMIFFKENTK